MVERFLLALIHVHLVPALLTAAFLGGCNVTSQEQGALSPRATKEQKKERDREQRPALDERGTPPSRAESMHAVAPIDHGIFGDLDERVQIHCPAWLDEAPSFVVADGARGYWLGWDGTVLCHSSGWRKKLDSSFLMRKSISLSSGTARSQDEDGDGIFDAVDVLRGAKKAALNAAHYKSNYRELVYPGGDVPRTEGVCTDVIIRALRNFGLDLQKEVHEDIARHPARYPMVQKSNPHIDHRRVRTLLPYFLAHTRSLPPSPEDSAFPLLPGDIVFLDTMKSEGPEHLGIVSDRLGSSGLPLLINNWNDGTVTTEMDLLDRMPVTHRFRVTGRLVPEPPSQGLLGVVARHGMQLPEETRQILLVTVPFWNSSGGYLQRWAREEGGTFRPESDPVAVRLGRSGLGCGRGLVPDDHCEIRKREGDKRAPSGLFSLGTAFGRAPHPPDPMAWPYRPTNARDFFVDDPKADLYNTWVQLRAGESMKHSAERLSMYEWGLVVHHNSAPVQKGAGSAIFIHPWKDSRTPTVGCTALDESDLIAVFRWLNPEAQPLLLQVVDHVF